MTSSKDIFLKDKQLAKWWISIVHDSRFDRVKIFARASVMENRLDPSQILGCEYAFSTLETIVDPETEPFDINDAKVGLDHNLTHERKLDNDTETQED